MGSSSESNKVTDLSVLIGHVEHELRVAIADIAVAQALMSQATALREEANDRVTRACVMLTDLNNALAHKIEMSNPQSDPGPDW